MGEIEHREAQFGALVLHVASVLAKFNGVWKLASGEVAQNIVEVRWERLTEVREDVVRLCRCERCCHSGYSRSGLRAMVSEQTQPDNQCEQSDPHD